MDFSGFSVNCGKNMARARGRRDSIAATPKICATRIGYVLGLGYTTVCRSQLQ